MTRRTLAWLRTSRSGLVVMALGVGAGAGLGAVGFRWLIYAFTWLATGHQEFGQQGRVGSLHLPWLGTGFLLVIPVVGGLLYGPLIQRFAREARGHGVPEVMIAVAEDGGRIRPQVTVVKAVASALCIGVGGSVGREGPIVQVGSALASSAGQLVRMSETRLRVLVACGAAGGIAATFNAPITGVFFGVELILRELSVEALFATILAAVTADLISRAFFGSAPFFAAMPHDLSLVHPASYPLVALLGVVAGLIGVGFKEILYRMEDLADICWRSRPEWARPAVGGVLLGALLLAMPQLYGVGYPVMDRAVAGHTVLWLLVALMAGKMVAASLTIGIGGSGGVFAPSLFTGAMAGMAFGVIAGHLFGAAAGPPAIYALVAMGAVFAAAAQAPLTSIASVLEMTGDFGLALPVMLGVGIAAGLSKRLTYGTIYTTKLLRRGTDIDRPKPATMLQSLTVADAMRRLAPRAAARLGDGQLPPPQATADRQLPGAVLEVRQPQALFAEETLQHALRQLMLYGFDGLPVVSGDEGRLVGWVSGRDVLSAMAARIAQSPADAAQGSMAAEWASPDPGARLAVPPTPVPGYEIIEIAVTDTSPARGLHPDELDWPAGSAIVGITDRHGAPVPDPGAPLRAGDRVVLVSRAGGARHPVPPAPPHAHADGLGAS